MKQTQDEIHHDIAMAFAALTASLANQLDAPSLMSDLTQIYETTIAQEPVGETYRMMIESAVGILEAIHGDSSSATH